MDEPVSELAFVLEPRIRPAVSSFPIEESIIEFAFIRVAIALLKVSLALNDIGIHVAFVCVFELSSGSRVDIDPAHLAIAVHLRVDEVSYIVSAIRPLELAEALDL